MCKNALGTAIIKRFHPQFCMCWCMGEVQRTNVQTICHTLAGPYWAWIGIFTMKLKCVLAVFDMWVFYPKFLWNADMFARWHTEQPSIG